MAGSFVVLKLDEAAIRHIGTVSGIGGQEFMRRVNRVKVRAQQLAPVDTGVLRSSISAEVRSDGAGLVARLGTPLDYAIHVHEGTGIYGRGGLIRPVRARALRWKGGGRGRATGGYTFAMWSRGSPGNPFLLKALPAFGS